MFHTLAFWFAYATLLGLSVNLFLFTAYSPWLKASLGLVTTALACIHLVSFPPLLGWPVDASVPNRFRFLAAQVSEPDKSRHTSGQIYLWAVDLSSDFLLKPPRAFHLPYSFGVHQAINDASNKLRKGLPQIGVVKGRDDGAQPTAFDVPDETSLTFYDLPDPLFPDPVR